MRKMPVDHEIPGALMWKVFCMPQNSTRWVPVVATFPREPWWGCCMIGSCDCSTYSMFKLWNRRCIMRFEKRSATGYCSGKQCFQTFGTEFCWWMTHASHGMGSWILLTSTHGLMKIPIPFKKEDYNGSLQEMLGKNNRPSAPKFYGLPPRLWGASICSFCLNYWTTCHWQHGGQWGHCM
jgi:hypothetical protein